jgi:hypothetical protein
MYLASMLLLTGCSDPASMPQASDIPAELSQFMAAITRLQHGASVDLNGDGRDEASSTLDVEGTLHFVLDPDLDGTPEYGSEERVDGSGLAWIDADHDGVREWERSRAAAPSLVETTLEDQDHDGRRETRTTETFDPAADTVRVVVERDAAGTGSFSLISDTVRPAAQAQAQSKQLCKHDDFLPSGGTTIRVGPVTIPIDGGGGRCTQEEAKRLMRALVCAIFGGEDCLEHVNPRLAGQIITALVANRSLTIGCALDPQDCDYDGITRPKQKLVNFNPRSLRRDTDGELCALVLHEMIHWAGSGHREETGNNHTDDVYSCARYCGGCRDDQTPNVDCARCAGNDFTVKEECGLKTDQEVGTCPTNALCHGGLGTNLPGETCEVAVTKYCDDMPVLDDPEFVCVKQCPANAQRCNDKPCVSSPPDSCRNLPVADRTSLGSCGAPPPACR